ncbi:helix-turn-helix domain-containing protein [Streptomonospora salina]|uniref:helix-turn-helix domain-containing protein n=1 Tax=Streptomonospora salina TaxID=104205 RepID=UPI0028A89018|nr:helix-turn-helix transcriptional regulator [Streptomonospora salina]
MALASAGTRTRGNNQLATSPLSVRRRRLSEELRRLRVEADLTHAEVAKRLEWSTGKVSNIETGVSKKPSVHDIRGLLDVYGVREGPMREALLELARKSRERGWWTKFSDVVGEYPALEADASHISTYEPLLLPGLLQTPDYAALVTRASLVRDPVDIQRAVDARKQRQEILTRSDPPAPEVWAVIDEAALMRVESERGVYREQVQHLIDVAEEPNKVTLQVLPMASGVHAGLRGPFVIMDFAGPLAGPVVFIETDMDGLYLEDDEEIDRYRRLLTHVQTAALPEDASTRFLKGKIAA